MWRKEGLSDESEAVKNANEEYKMDMDSVGTFVTDCFEIDASMKWWLHTKLLYETYIKWCAKNNEKIMTQKWLALRMQEKGFKRMASNGKRMWLGLVLRDEWRT